MAESSSTKPLADLWRLVCRRKGLFLLSASVFAVAALHASHLLPLKYTGRAKFERRTDVATSRSRGQESESFETIKLTLHHELAGRAAVDHVAEELGLVQGNAFPREKNGQLTHEGQMAKQELVESLKQRIEVK